MTSDTRSLTAQDDALLAPLADVATTAITAQSLSEIPVKRDFFSAPTFLLQHIASAMQAFYVAIEQLLFEKPLRCADLLFALNREKTQLSHYYVGEEGARYTHPLSEADLKAGKPARLEGAAGLTLRGLTYERGELGRFGLLLDDALYEELAALSDARRAHLFRLIPTLLMALFARSQELASSMRLHGLEGCVMLAQLDERGERRGMSWLLDQMAYHINNKELLELCELGVELLRRVRHCPNGEPARVLCETGVTHVSLAQRDIVNQRYGDWSVLRFDSELWRLTYQRYVQLPKDIFSRYNGSLYDLNAAFALHTKAALDHASHEARGSEQQVTRLMQEAALFQPWRQEPSRQEGYLQRALLRLSEQGELERVSLAEEVFDTSLLARGAGSLLSPAERERHTEAPSEGADEAVPQTERCPFPRTGSFSFKLSAARRPAPRANPNVSASVVKQNALSQAPARKKKKGKRTKRRT